MKAATELENGGYWILAVLSPGRARQVQAQAPATDASPPELDQLVSRE